MKHLIEFPDDELAFDFREVTKIYSMEQSATLYTCHGKCPDSEKHVGVDFSYVVCNNIKHRYTIHPTVITISGEDHTILRPFHDVMLYISTHRQPAPHDPHQPNHQDHKG